MYDDVSTTTGVIQNNFTAPKPSVLHLVLPPPPRLLATTDPSSLSRVLPLRECHVVGIIQFASFLDSPLSLSNVHARVRHVLHGLIAHFLLFLKKWTLFIKAALGSQQN